MFGYRDSCSGRSGRVEVRFTDARLDLQHDRPGFAAALDEVRAEVSVPVAWIRQVHGTRVVDVDGVDGVDGDVAAREAEQAEADGLVTAGHGVALMVRAADCVPLLLADPDAGVVAAVHAGRPGLALDVAGGAVRAMRARGAEHIRAWIGPHVCGACYEVPETMRDEVAARWPSASATTSWGTPSLDIGAGVRAQVEGYGVQVVHTGPCTREDPRWHSYRRDGAAAGRHAGLVWVA